MECDVFIKPMRVMFLCIFYKLHEYYKTKQERDNYPRRYIIYA